MSFGENLQNLRKSKKLSQEKVAELVGVSRQAVSKWENDLSNPDTKNLIRLAEIFDVSMDELLGSTQSNEGEYLNISNEEKIKEKRYYYNETRTKLISYILLIVFFPLNVYFYNKGIYGEVYLELGFLGKQFLKDSLLYDIPFIIFVIGGLIKFTKDIKNSENTMVIIKRRDKIISYLSFLVVSLITIVIYLKFPPYSSIAMFLCMFAFVHISIYETIRELTKKVLG